MSFCNANRGRAPGFLNGNPTSGLCESVCLTVKRVLDGCLKRQPRENVSITLTEVTPANPVEPFTFISCKTVNTKGVISDLVIEPIPDSNRRAAVSAIIGIPTTIIFVDANGNEFIGTGLAMVPISTVLCLPENSLVPFQVEATTAITCFRGNWVDGLTFIVDCCIIILIKLTSEVEMLFPTYGYMQFSECTDMDDLICRGFNSTPIYPPARR